MKRAILALLLSVALASPALAQQAPSPERLRAAGELLDAMNMQETLTRTADVAMKQQMAQAPVMAQFEDILRDFMTRAMRWEDLRADYVRAYAEVYTVDELNQLRAFYGTPLGRRLLATIPELSARSMDITNRRMQQLMPEMQRRMMERMQSTPTAAPKPAP